MKVMSFGKVVGLRIALCASLFAVATHLGAQQNAGALKKPVAPAVVAKPANKGNVPPVGYVPPGVVMPPPPEETSVTRSVGSNTSAEVNALTPAAALETAASATDKPSSMTTEVMPAPQTFGGKQTKLALVIGNAD